ncbi:cordon-bleu protein-like 1b [Myxocyprinus asiaticus]|uniref:cordon-bleu protein-like 1b n=1 Tax=Myxocyprinus asiaticus TaxID=70543 RepID=UPI0022229085|nr:cordon-bleu protein-like 1b [Myxocyprinus asiaticus]
MTLDRRVKHRGRARDFRAAQTATGMDGNANSRPPDRRRSSKSKAPPPPPVLKGLDAPLLNQKLPASPHPAMEQKENLLKQELTLTVVLPGGVEKTTVVHGSKPMMDLLVTLCAKYHLNPSAHTIELITNNRNHVKFKPNALIGALEAEKILLKPKGMEDKSKKTGPQMPEATVRLVINYRKTQKTILRVSPRVPLRELLPAICEKCEFDVYTTVLLRNVHSEDTLDLSGSLSDFGLREVYAKDTKVISPGSPGSLPPSPTRSEIIHRGKDKIQKENKGLFGLFRKGSKKQSEQSMTVSAPASPVHRRQRPVSMSSLSTYSPMYDSNTMPSDTPKKRRAPLPPCMMSQSMPTDLSHHQGNAQTPAHPDGNQHMAPLSRGSSTESSFKKTSTKRKAPPPPTLTSIAPHDETTQGKDLTEPVLASPLEEIKEQEEVSMKTESQACPLEEEHLEDDSSLNLSADVSLDSGQAGTLQDSESVESLSPLGTARENPSCNLSVDREVAESTVNGELKSDQALTACVQSEEIEPLNEKTEKVTQSSQSGSVLKEVSVSDTETDASLFNMPQTSDCGIQTLYTHTDLHAQCLNSNTVALQAVPMSSPKSIRSAHFEEQTQKTNRSAVSLAHTETQTQTEPETLPTEPLLSFCTEPPMMPSSPSMGLKKDMATSTEELHVPQPQTHTVQPSKCPASTQTAPKSGNILYFADAEPKPKPSNELTREYIPKVGMTTYTIVPQKSLEKRHLFEVELTLEPCDDGSVKNLDCRPDAKIVQAQTTNISPPPGHLPLFTNGIITLNGHKSVSIKATELSQMIPPVSPTASISSPSSPLGEGTESFVKEKKVPPATRPKPASFRLPQHKRTPGDYVISAAVRRSSVGSTSSSSSTCSSPAARPKEAARSLQSDASLGTALNNFPPPPPPVQWDGEEQHAELSDVPLPEVQPKPQPILKDVEASSDVPLPEVQPIPQPILKDVDASSDVPLPEVQPKPKPILKDVKASSVVPLPEVQLKPQPILKDVKASGVVPPPEVQSKPQPILKDAKASSDVPLPEVQPKPETHSKVIEASKFPPSSLLSRQKSLPTNPRPSLSLEKLRSFAAPKPFSPTSPSRFAQAVSTAVKRSQSLSHRPLGQSPRKLPVYPLSAQSSIRESPEPPTSTVTDNGEGRTEGYREAPSETAGPGDAAQSSAQHEDMGTCKIGNTQPSLPGSEASLVLSPTLKGISEALRSVEE